MAGKNGVKNGTSFWWEKKEPSRSVSGRHRFRKFTSAKKLLEKLQDQN